MAAVGVAATATGSSSAYMLDDDDAECPLCLDTLDISDLNFKPCSCGYQICSFCWHHIKENLNGRCPACRKPYDDAAIEFKPMKPDELKRLQAAKKQRDRERKDAGSLSKRHAANVRVKQRAQVHIQGMTTKMANEDTLAYLKGPEQFGKYGKILKLFFSRRAHPPPANSISSALTPTTSSSSNIITSTSAPNYSPVNVYINYAHPSEATACINALDGSLTPDGHKLKAIWGTTRYCPAFLRGVKCTNDNCMQAHEAGEEVESNTHPGSSTVGSTARGEANLQAAARFSGTDRAEMRDLKHAWKEQPSNTSSSSNTQKDSAQAAALPATASWASRPAAQTSASYSNSLNNLPPLAPSSSSSNHAHSSSISSRLPKAQNHPLPPRPPSRSATASSSTSDSNNKGPIAKNGKTTLQAEPLRYDSIEYSDAWAEDIEYVKKPSSKNSAGLREPAVSSSNKSSASAASSSPGTIAPPTPPVSDGSSSSEPASNAATTAGTTILPPGLPINLPPQQMQQQQQPQRPLTPLSEFDRTLDTFGDGLSFAFNLSAMNDANSTPGAGNAVSADLHSDSMAANGGIGHAPGSSANSSNYTSRSGTPDHFINGEGSNKDDASSIQTDEEQMRYAGHFDPFAALGGGDMMDSPTAISSTSANGIASTTSASASPATRSIALPPGMMMSRVSTSEGSNASGPPPGLGGLAKAPPGLSTPAQQAADDSTTPTANRHRSRFGFARQGSAEKPLNSSSSSSAATSASASLGSIAGMSIPVSELFKGINGVAHASSPAASSGLNGHHSPIRPASATSSNHGFALSPGVFPSAASASLPPQNPAAAAFTPSSGSIPLPLAAAASSTAGAASLDLPLPPPDPSKAKGASKQSLSDLFPGVNLEASFSASSSLPPALVKSLGISLENLDVSATSLTSGKKLPNFSPMTLGQGNSIGNQALPPPNSATSSNGGGTSQPGSATTSQGPPHSANSSSSNAPPGFGSTRQAQQAHAQHAQQAHQAYLAAQQAQREQREREAQQQQQAQQAQQAQQQHHMHGRPPSAASAGSAGKGAQHDMYGYMHSPPLPGTPGFSDASRFQDPAIVSFANLNGYGHHHPFAHHGPYQHHGPMPGHEQPNGQGNGEYYNRYHPLPTPIQPQQTYNPYIPVAPVGMGGMGRLQAQGLSQAGAFGLMRR